LKPITVEVPLYSQDYIQVCFESIDNLYYEYDSSTDSIDDTFLPSSVSSFDPSLYLNGAPSTIHRSVPITISSLKSSFIPSRPFSSSIPRAIPSAVHSSIPSYIPSREPISETSTVPSLDPTLIWCTLLLYCFFYQALSPVWKQVPPLSTELFHQALFLVLNLALTQVLFQV
jgi:hypothetical protein